MKEISRSCRDFFFSAEKLNEVKAPQTALFEFSDMNAYWLISELLDIVTPENVTKTIKALFLEEMLNLISTSQAGMDEADKIKRLKQSASLLGEQPFVNIILTCQNSEDKGRENLVTSMLNFCQDLMTKYDKNPELCSSPQFELERESMLLRINLIGGMIDFNSTSADTLSGYGIILFQLLWNEVVTIERDGDYFYYLYDMLTLCLLSLFTGPGLAQYNTSGEMVKPRYPDYQGFLKKFRREFGERQISIKLFGLQQLLPIKQTQAEIQSFNDAYSLNSPVKGSGSKTSNGTVAGFARNVKPIRIDKQAEPPQKKILRMIYHTHQNEFFHPGTPGKPVSKSQLEAFVVGPPDYPEVPKAQQAQPGNLMRQNMPNQANYYERQMSQGMASSGPPSAGNFPGGPPSVGSFQGAPMMTPNSMQPPGGFSGPQGAQYNPMGMHQPPQNPNFIPSRMPIQEPIMRPPISTAPGSIRAMKKRGSSSALTAPTGPRAAKRPKREMDQGQMQPPGNAVQNPPPYFSHQQKQQGGQWNAGHPQQGFNMNQVPNRFPAPGQPPGNVPLNPQMMQRADNSETKEILKATIQKKNKDKQGGQIPPGQMRHSMMQNMPMGPGGPQMNMGQGQRMPMNPNMQNPNQFPPGHMQQNNF